MVEVGLWGCHERTATNGGGHPRGKQFLLIQRSHPHGGAKAWWTRSWTSLLLDLPSSSPRQPVPFTNECSRSPSLALHLFLRPSRLLPPRSSPLPQNPLRLGPFIFILLILLSLSPSHSLSLSLLFLFFCSKQIRLRSRHRCKVSTAVRLKVSGPPWVNVYPRLKSNEPPPCGVAYKVCPGY